MTIHVNDWMSAMGVVALLRIEPTLQDGIEANRLHVPLEWYNDLPEKLFAYLVNEYSIAKTELKIIERWIHTLTEDDKSRFKEVVKWINERQKKSADKIKKYFPEHVSLCELGSKELQEAVKQTSKSLVLEWYEKFKAMMTSTEVDRKLTLNYVKAMILGAVGGQVSFLNVAKNGLTFTEQIELFRKDYIAPIIWEMKVQQFLVDRNEEGLVAFMTENDEHPLAKSWLKQQKKEKCTMIELVQRQPECSLLSGHFSTLEFEEMHFVPLGMSMSKAFNYSWDGQLASGQPISALAKLLLFLSPLGNVSYRRTYKGEDLTRFFGFLYNSADLKVMLAINNELANALSDGQIFTESLHQSFKKLEELEKKRQKQAFLIEWTSDYNMKKTLLEYRAIHPNFVKFVLSDGAKWTNAIFPFDFRERVVRAAMDNQDSKRIIWAKLHETLSDGRFAAAKSLKYAMLMREQLIRLKEDVQVGETKLVTDRMHTLGFLVAKHLYGNEKKTESEIYVASKDKKIVGIVYRLMNAAKSGNRQLFFDTAVRLHVLAGLNVSKDFIRACDPKTPDHEFATVALAFVGGLIPNQHVPEDKKEEVTNG